MIKSFIKKIIKIIFPESCFICNKKEEVLCNVCLGKLSKSIDKPFLYATSIYNFKDKNIKNIIHAIKYHHRKDLIVPITKEMILEVNKIVNEHNDKKYIIVPIPMPKIRKYIRGYNHSEKIAVEISNATKIPVDNNILVRTKNTIRQVKSFSRSERIKNQKNSFAINSSSLNLKEINIILIDDVITTGATISEARNVLLKYGANKVFVISIAH